MPSIGKGKFSFVYAICSFTQRWALFKRARTSVHPEPTSVIVKVWQNWPDAFEPQWLRVSISKNPGLRSSLLKQTLTGIWLFKRVPRFVVLIPLTRKRSFSFLSFRSMVAGLTVSSNVRSSFVRCMFGL